MWQYQLNKNTPVNYIQEINAFYDRLEGSPPLSNKAIALWFALMHINNKTKWTKSFHAAISTLETKSGIGRTELFKARKELEAAGFIDWKQRDKMQCASYTMIPLFGRSIDDFPNENDDQIGDDYYEKTGLEAPEEAQEINDAELENTIEEPAINPPSEDYVGNKNGDKTGNKNGNKKGSKLVTISKQNKRIQKKTKKRFDEGKPSLSSSDDERKIFNKQILKIFRDYNRICLNLQPVTSKTDMRKKHVGARLKEHGMPDVQKMLKLAAASDFLGGCNNINWKANFDWLFLPTNFVKVLEGNYNNRTDNSSNFGKTQGSVENYIGKPSHLQIIEQTYNNLMNDGFFE